MEEYPEELRTPPVALVALLGCPDLHASISSHLHSDQPPVNTLALPDFSKIHVIAGADPNYAAAKADSSGGVLKREWLLKHRTRVPAVVAAIFRADHVAGDPAQWMQVCSDLDNLKAVVRGRNSKLVLVLVANYSSNNEVSEDRILALRKRAEVDAKHLIVFVPNDKSEQKQSLKRLGSVFAELANIYYRDEGRRIKIKLERKSITSVELSIRYCFKVAVYAEFRRDWAEALRFYEDGYNTLREMIGMPTKLPAIQRLVAIKTIAEQLHFKISTLLLHLGKFIEAIIWFRQHSSSYKKLEGASEVTFLHWEWLSRQYLTFAELLETSSANTQNTSSLVSSAAEQLSEWELHPAYYYQLAAHYLKEKRDSLEFALSMSEMANDSNGNADSIAPSNYVGQFARLLENGDSFELQSITDEEYVRYALAEGKRFQDTFEIMALLKKSFEAFTNLKAQRMVSYCGFEMAKEYFAVNDYKKAKQLFDDIAVLYRKEGWGILLWEVLGYLRECSRNLGFVKDFVEYSLEMAALPVSASASVQFLVSMECGPAGPATLTQREKIQDEVLRLVRGNLELPVNENNILKVNNNQPLHLEVDLVSPLRVVLIASVAFHEQMIKPGVPTLITVSLLSQLPHLVEIDKLEIQFNQDICNYTIVNGERTELATVSGDHLNQRVEIAPALTLSTNKWLRLTYEVKSDQSGKLECTSVIAKIGQHFSICCRSESPASMNELPLWKFEDRVETFPTKDPGLAFSGQKATQVEEPDPQVDLNLGASGPALVGERFIVPVTILAKGHNINSGELKINIVDTKGGGLLSPREVEPFSSDSLHVELLNVSGLDSENELENGNDNIQKIQPTFGLIIVPFLKEGDSWSCKLEIQWNRPKPIMLYVSLGYSPHSTEINSQKVHVHKSLEIEGKTGLVLNHKYMLPFRRDPLLLSKIKQSPDSDQTPALPLNETSILIVTAKNIAEIPLQLLSVNVEVGQDEIGKSCTVKNGVNDRSDPALLVPGGEFKKIFSLIPKINLPKLKVGTVSLRWRRDSVPKDTAVFVTKHKLEDIDVEFSPLVVNLECPPHAILGNPFTYYIKIQNQTPLLQEIKFSLADSQSFVLSGSHNDTIFVLPKSQYIISYKLVPLASGSQPLPKVTVTSVRYSAGFQSSVSASTVFVYPSEPHFERPSMKMRPELIAAE